jgi:hypothetical protein
VIVFLIGLTLVVMPKGEISGTPYGIGYLIGAFLPAIVLSVLYVWWYRRRQRN